MAIKVIVTEKAYYHGEILKPGRIISIKEDDIPSWAKKTSGKQTGKTNEPVQDDAGENKNQNQGFFNLFNFGKSTITETGATELNITELSKKTEDELKEILDELINKGIENHVYLENSENKSLIEQITELKIALEQKQGNENV